MASATFFSMVMVNFVFIILVFTNYVLSHLGTPKFGGRAAAFGAASALFSFVKCSMARGASCCNSTDQRYEKDFE